MNSGGFLLFIVGALALAGFLTGNLDRWLGFLFTPGGSEAMGVGGAVTKNPPAGAAPAAGVVAPSANQRGQAG